ncbi:hypothetical protein [Brucella anthropi]|uniref:hypothetical protein n=1 Tax=Brucella anthropi TaxID=529 RepID=UPI00194DEA8F|nr:hypothetical protein [Brucella anthropi]
MDKQSPGGVEPRSTLLITTQLGSFGSGLYSLDFPNGRVFRPTEQLLAANFLVLRVRRPIACATGKDEQGETGDHK